METYLKQHTFDIKKMLKKTLYNQNYSFGYTKFFQHFFYIKGMLFQISFHLLNFLGYVLRYPSS